MNPVVKAAADKWNAALGSFLDFTHAQPKGTFLYDACGLLAITVGAVFGAMGTPFMLLLGIGVNKAKSETTQDNYDENLRKLGPEWNAVHQAFLDMWEVAKVHGSAGDQALCELMNQATESAIRVLGDQEKMQQLGGIMFKIYSITEANSPNFQPEEPDEEGLTPNDRQILQEDCNSCPNAGQCDAEDKMRAAKADLLARTQNPGGKEYIH